MINIKVYAMVFADGVMHHSVPMALCQSPRHWVALALTSNHRNLSSFWKSLVAMDVCSVIPCPEVSSRLPQIKPVLFESWFRNPPKELKLGKQFQQNFVSSWEGPIKNAGTRQGWKCPKLHVHYYKTMVEKDQIEGYTLYICCIYSRCRVVFLYMQLSVG